MPTYRYTHVYDAIFPDLQHGVNADVKGASDEPAGSTVVLSPGDEVTTGRKYRHAFLEPIKPSQSGSEDDESDENPGDDESNDEDESAQDSEPTEPTE